MTIKKAFTNYKICINKNKKLLIYGVIFRFVRLDPPEVRLHVGGGLNPEDVKIGDDFYFECDIQANPPPYKITWSRNVSEKNVNNINIFIPSSSHTVANNLLNLAQFSL